MGIAENARIVLNKVAEAALRAGRKPEDVAVIGVTKTVGPDSVIQMARGGINIAGENRVQELLAKREALADTLPDLSWHMIGHLQSNKVKHAVASSDMIHSVDSMKLAALIDKQASEIGKVMDVLVEVNIAKEESKYGIFPERVFDFVCGALGFGNINIRGLMCVAPFVDNPEENRPHFQKMADILNDINGNLFRNGKRLGVLSMGMTLDYEVAVEQGATMVRVGTAIFGARDYI
ncbi:MAG: YggS family pyridoxal phosphate-dependent enzyme [Defluviitaleaceae bacterium]|nr:YggS family pyridoxal phosphate-dependent enzyme [Defluviitaleaceae bacterium]MCL2835636.1 YggS family pyridoxal phosphate-dependent enzyme [Defluviitaleaceae bacterium]